MYINDYEDAKRYIEKDIDGLYDKRIKRLAKLRALFIAGLGNAALLTVGIIKKEPAVAAFSPAILLWASTAFLSIFERHKEKEKIANGSYFRNKSAADVISQANKQIQITENEEEKGMKH